MDEIGPGIFHWTAEHPETGGTAHSHLIAEAATVLDPMALEEALELLHDRPPERVAMTNRHHYRQADALVAEFGVPVLCPRPGLHEFEGDERAVEPYDSGDELAPGLTAHVLGAICPDDFVLHARVGHGWLAFADGLIRRESGLGFVSDGLLGDDPAAVKRALYDGLEPLLGLDFDGLLFAHGDPLPSGGHAALSEFVSARD